ncbi:LANO_0F12816g1_1 [Lachancea nothofagi CBS 11611]|uniref:Pre-mRNA-splicing factor SLT11 n=1 Tax=Lachancea nothofagi CBS 11611 TaxID=1266666 RepID=A0A1G4KBG5_9SACH|nr:LANO_0F12816g1_1 [Lachancea nothofagi CBS 11611]
MDFAICESCLSGQTRLTRAPNGAECKICTLPFTVYHFKASSKINRTLICHNCSKQRNICQCCMLDLQWQIPVELRDRVLSAVQGSQVTTQEAQNEMMKRFIALKNGDSYKLGGASITSDAASTAQILERIRGTLAQIELPGDKSKAAKPIVAPNSASEVDISHLIKKLPLKNSLETAQSFFLYNIDSSIPEWAIVEAVSEVVETSSWQDPVSTSVVINHMARCGGIRFKTSELASKFVNGIEAFQTPANVTKGKLALQNSKIHVVAWPHFHRAAMGNKNSECLKLAQVLEKLVQKDLTTAGESGSKARQSKVAKPNKKRASVKTKKNRRAIDIEL